MYWPYLLLLTLLLQTPAPRQQPQQQQPARPEDRGSITGYIVRMRTGDALSKPTVTITTDNAAKNQPYAATSTTGVQFSLKNLERGKSRPAATRAGYVRMEYGARSPSRPGLPITLSPGQRLTNIV